MSGEVAAQPLREITAVQRLRLRWSKKTKHIKHCVFSVSCLINTVDVILLEAYQSTKKKRRELTGQYIFCHGVL